MLVYRSVYAKGRIWENHGESTCVFVDPHTTRGVFVKIKRTFIAHVIARTGAGAYQRGTLGAVGYDKYAF